MNRPGKRAAVRNAAALNMAIAALMLAATPATAARFVQFAFTDNGEAANGPYVPDCPPGAGDCVVTDAKGLPGAEKLSLNQPKSPPTPPSAAPDNQLPQPDYKPANRAAHMSHGNSSSNIVAELSLPGREPRVLWRSHVADNGAIIEEFPLLDYQVSVPEPGSWLLMLGGFGFIGLAVRRRRRLLTLSA